LSAEEETVRLKATALPFYAQVVRVAVFLLASRLDFDLEQVEDLRIAVDEAWNHAVSHSTPQDEVEVEIGVKPGAMRITVTSSISKGKEEPGDISQSFSRLILDAVCDDLRVEHEGGRCRITLSKLKEGRGSGGAGTR
jgi:serine/threonine-protein kinase RsbW